MSLRSVAAIFLTLTGCSNASTTSDGGTALGLSGTPCASPVDITVGGAFQGDTCQSPAMLPADAGCGGVARAAIFEVTPEPQNWSREFYVSPGFTISGSDSRCSFGTADCVNGGIQGAGASYGTEFYLAVQLEDGGCGPFTLNVYNATTCGNRADGGGCMCGNIPACPVGQLCHQNEPQLTGTCVSN